MKRKTTDLEQRLINNGYRLTKKQYGGRKSEKTLFYLYEKGDQFVKLDYKRESVLSLGISEFHQPITKLELENLRLKLYNIDQDIVDNWVTEEIEKENGVTIPFELPEGEE